MCACCRTTQMFRSCFELLVARRRATQRELFYHLKPLPDGLFSTPALVNAAMRDVCLLLRCTRSNLNITCTSRGAVTGCLEITVRPPFEHCWCVSMQERRVGHSKSCTHGGAVTGAPRALGRWTTPIVYTPCEPAGREFRPLATDFPTGTSVLAYVDGERPTSTPRWCTSVA